MDSKAQWSANLAKENKKLRQTNASAHLIQYRFKIREGSPEGIRMTMEERICERNESGLWSD